MHCGIHLPLKDHISILVYGYLETLHSKYELIFRILHEFIVNHFIEMPYVKATYNSEYSNMPLIAKKRNNILGGDF